ncbi:F-box/kelch-repeat protein At3g23880-like [Vicia villosa]|uniref:F-box/kelch-repeat protein At3g23880-like n=1 Tax=Vicia villosa TaxID=3911 RepID=UPI00273C4E11|nr:F-box/kelch-repeat protein At3g23880-like [Vicia villosa]
MSDSLPMLPVYLPDELITEVLSFLPVKSLMRLRCVSKSWNTLIYDPTFVNHHLKRSSRNINLILYLLLYIPSNGFNFTCFPLRSVPDIIPVLLADNLNLQLNDGKGFIGPIGSCNGLLCLIGYFPNKEDILLYIWNPATITLSNKIVFPCMKFSRLRWMFAFGYDISSNIYKIVAFHPSKNEVRVFNLEDNIWRNIQSFPIIPICSAPYSDCQHQLSGINQGVHVSGTLNWLAIRNEFPYEHEIDWKLITIDQFVIISLDLSTETYHQLLLPRGFDEVPLIQPTLSQLMGSLCLSHDFRGTDFIIWQMKEFRIQESWTQLFKISYQRLQIDFSVFTNSVPYGSRFILFPLCLSENDNTLILTWNRDKKPIVYNLKDNRVEKTNFDDGIRWFLIKDYVESLVSTS